MAKCEICGKTPHFGRNVSHSKRHTRRQVLPHVVRATLVLNGQPVQLRTCTRCLRTHYKQQRPA
ncbi:MAG: 50S ribosomal protein L28 [Chloroflexi bacterium]|nr:50S ribosomal protein L28 [Chloroflexota bacterium]